MKPPHQADRLDFIQSLVEYSKSTHELSEQIGKFEWDYEGEPVRLQYKHISSVLEKYLRGELTAQDVEVWANLIEGREDVAPEKDCAEHIDKIIYELANPELTAPLDKTRAEEIIVAIT